MKVLYLIVAVLLFGFLVAVHELGHFLAAKLCGVQVNEFSIGMGPLVWGRKGKETQYSLRAFPIGGYCAMEGEDEDTGNERAFVRQGFWRKLLILVAGAAMNFLTGVLIVAILFSGAAYFYADRVTGLAPEAAESGLLAGDQIYKINGYRTYMSGDASLYFRYSPDSAEVEVIRGGKHVTVHDLPRRTVTSDDGTQYVGFGVFLGTEPIHATFRNRVRFIWYQTMDFVQLVWFSLAQLLTGNAGVQDLSGPVGIVSTITQVGTEAETASAAWTGIAYFAALLAVNLAVVNLLPLPALDGGRILFLLVDAVSMLLFKKKIPEKFQTVINTAGLVLLLGFMLFVTFQDVFKLVT